MNPYTMIWDRPPVSRDNTGYHSPHPYELIIMMLSLVCFPKDCCTLASMLTFKSRIVNVVFDGCGAAKMSLGTGILKLPRLQSIPGSFIVDASPTRVAEGSEAV